MRLSPEMNLILFAHYLQALEFQRKSCQVVAILGGKNSSHPESRGWRSHECNQPQQLGDHEYGSPGNVEGHP